MKKYLLSIFVLLLAASAYGADREELIRQVEMDFPEPHYSGALRDDKDCGAKLATMLRYFKQGQCRKGVAWLDVIGEIDSKEYSEILGYMYANGDCVERDISKAIKWLRGSNMPSARSGLLQLFLTYPNQPTISPVEAFQIAEYNAKNGRTLGALALSDFYKRGIGAIQSYSRAYMWAQVGTVTCPIPELRELAQSEVVKLSRHISPNDIKRLKEAAQKEVDAIIAPRKAKAAASTTSYLYSIN